MEVARSKKGIIVSQKKYVLNLLKETGMSGCRPANTSIESNQKLGNDKEGELMDTSYYQRLVGKLIYLSHIAWYCICCKFCKSVHAAMYEKHLEAIYRIFRYLKSIQGKGLLFQGTTQQIIKAQTYADWAWPVIDRKSTSSTYILGKLVTWRSKKQNVVARSSADAKNRSTAHGVCEMLWLKRVLEELKITINLPMKLYDNKAAIIIAQNPVQHDRTKYVEVDGHLIKEKTNDGAICMPYIPTTQQTAMSSPKDYFNLTLSILLASWAWLTYMHQLEGGAGVSKS